jgi:hypothetical protein
MSFTLLRVPSLAVIVGLSLAASFLVAAIGGCGTEKRVKECVSRCEAEGQSCERRREANCAARGRVCAEGCERNAGKAL